MSNKIASQKQPDDYEDDYEDEPETEPETETPLPRNKTNVIAIETKQRNKPVTEKQPEPETEKQPVDWDKIDFDKLLERHFPKQNWLDRQPDEVLGPALTWGGYFLKGLAKPINYFLDGGDQQEESAPGQAEYMSFLKRSLYQVGGAAIWAWSAFLTQAVTARIFPFVDKAINQESAGGFFQHGLTISVKAIIASAIFTFMLSVIETMLYDKNKGPGKKLLILFAFLVDIAVNSIAYTDFLGHNQLFEWNPLVTAFRGKELEWGSFMIEFAAILNAGLPELMWEKARRAKRAAKAGKVSQRQSNERGMWMGNKWYSESELRAIAKQRRKARH